MSLAVTPLTLSWPQHARPLTNNLLKMKKTTLFLGLIVLSFITFAQEKVINDANAVKRNAKNFHAIEIGDGIDLYLSQSNEETVAVGAAKTEDRDKITTEVEDGVLKIYYRPRNDWHFGGNNRLRAYVSFKTLDRLSGSGGSDISVSGTIKGSKLRISLSGGGDFEGAVEVADLNVDQSGGGDVKISGKATNLKIESSGGGDFKGFDLASETCYASGSGGSDMQLWVNKELSVNTSGGGDVRYKGSAVIREIKTSGGGSVSKRE
jgi:hypothetical protein